MSNTIPSMPSRSYLKKDWTKKDWMSLLECELPCTLLTSRFIVVHVYEELASDRIARE